MRPLGRAAVPARMAVWVRAAGRTREGLCVMVGAAHSA